MKNFKKKKKNSENFEITPQLLFDKLKNYNIL